MSLMKEIEPAFKGNLVTVRVDNHGFDIRPVFGPQSKVIRTSTSLIVSNYFRHRIVGKDDRVHYLIEVEAGKPYRARLDKIEYRGIGKNRLVQFGIEVTGAVKEVGGTPGVVARAIEGLLKRIGQIHRFFIGKKWELAAAKVIDALGERMVRELKPKPRRVRRVASLVQ